VSDVKRVLIVSHTAETDVEKAHQLASTRFAAVGWQTLETDQYSGQRLDLVLVLGGDGTLLRAAELVHHRGTPILGVNLGHLGFLAESEAGELTWAIDRVAAGEYQIERRATLEVTVTQPGEPSWHGWALNEVTIEKSLPQKMIELMLSIDGQDVSSFGCDGLVVSTATGSTGHAFSGGGPVVWPEFRALLVVPLAAHALFDRPLLVTPRSIVTVDLSRHSRSPALASCDGRRTAALGLGGRMDVTVGAEDINLVRFGGSPFSARLVRKFSLPVSGWRGRDHSTAQSATGTDSLGGP
jgi:NAD+ kinase